MNVKMIKITNNERLFEKMKLLKKKLNKKFKSSIKTNPQLIEYLVDEKITELRKIGVTFEDEKKED